MLIKSQFLDSGELRLDAYTYDPKEFAALESVLSRTGVPTTFQSLPVDRINRQGRAYFVSSGDVSRLETELNGTFLPNGNFSPSLPAGKSFRCREMDLTGSGPACEDLTASDLPTAQVTCALIANNRGWLGGVPSPGRCP